VAPREIPLPFSSDDDEEEEEGGHCVIIGNCPSSPAPARAGEDAHLCGSEPIPIKLE